MNTASYRDPRNPGAELLPDYDWDLPPHHRWTFQHIREMTPTAQVWRGPGPVMPLPMAPQDIGSIAFACDGRASTVDSFIEESSTDGFLVLHRGAILHERYLNGMAPRRTHLAMSVTKSIVGVLCGVLAGQGRLDLAAPVTHYLPELQTTAYRGATVQHLLDMTSGVTFDESYYTSGSHMQKLGAACGWGSRPQPGWPRTMWELVLTLTGQERGHGTHFQYRSIETDVLGFVLERATATSLAELLSRELWAPMGAQEDADITVDKAGTALADGGFCATLQDYGRFARMLLDGGRVDDRQLVPSAWIEETRSGKGGVFEGIYLNALPRGAYHNQFWIVDPVRRTYLARGIFGQFIYLDPSIGYAAVKLSTWPTPLWLDGTLQTLAAFTAIGRALGAP
jgi:CubicO group peptidase (beta-lactamase class C family)